MLFVVEISNEAHAPGLERISNLILEAAHSHTCGSGTSSPTKKEPVRRFGTGLQSPPEKVLQLIQT